MNTALKIGNFASTANRKETPLDKTTRIVKRITEDEAQMRQLKTARLRKARYESEEATVDVSINTTLDRSDQRRE